MEYAAELSHPDMEGAGVVTLLQSIREWLSDAPWHVDLAPHPGRAYSSGWRQRVTGVGSVMFLCELGDLGVEGT